MNKVSAGIVVVSHFVVTKNKIFQGYIDYIDRDEAVRSDNYYKFDLYSNYMDNPNKTVPSIDGEEIKNHKLSEKPEEISALFTATKNSLTLDEKQILKEQFRKAQRNGSPMWQDVISFDNNFLEKHGVYSKNPFALDESKIREVTRLAMTEKFKNEKMTASGVWSASIHYNTDNIHIHIASVEPSPTRKVMEYNGIKQYRGKLMPKTLDKMKSKVVNNIVDRGAQLKEINDLIRENIVGATPKKVMTIKDEELLKKLKEIYKRLPEDKRQWQYNMNGIKEVRPLLDDFTKTYVRHYHSNDFKKLSEKLSEQETFLKEAYGSGQTGRSAEYQQTKIKEIYTRVGNVVLKQLKTYDTLQNKKVQAVSKHRVPTRANTVAANMKQRKDFRNGFYELKRAIAKDFSKVKLEREHERLMEDIDMER